MDQAGTQKPYSVNATPSAKRIELDCRSCGGRLSLDATPSEDISCPFCRQSALGSTTHYFKQEVAIPMKDSVLVGQDQWKVRYQKQKRWWMRRRFCEKKIEGLMDLLLTGNGRIVAVAVGMAVVGGVLAFVIGVS